jgi:relaxase-like protein
VIAKITRGGSLRGAARYVLDERRGLDRDHQPEMIAGNMAGRTSAELAREFEAVRQQRPDIRKPVEHVALSFARDERPLSNDEMARLADEYLKRRGHDPDRVQYVVVRHRDKDHQHCHILLNRPLRRRRRPFRLPSPSRVLSRLPGYEEARTALWLAHNMELASRAPGRAALNIAERLLPPDARTAVGVIRSVIDLSRGR